MHRLLRCLCSSHVRRSFANIRSTLFNDRRCRSSLRAVLTIRDSKFFKSRLVPIGTKTVRMLAEYDQSSCDMLYGAGPMHRSLLDETQNTVTIYTFERAFIQIRVHAGLHREGGPRNQPRLHDLRHTSAVHRLTTWYREGKDVQKLLPQLSVYMGHTNLGGYTGVSVDDTGALA